MNLFSENLIDHKNLFISIFTAPTEKELIEIINSVPEIFDNPDNWHPLGDNTNNFAVIKNQQANPVAALIEKVTNSVDAILMKK